LSELSIFEWKGKGVGTPSAYYVLDDEWNYTILYMHMNMEEVHPYFDMFDETYGKRIGQPTLKQLNLGVPEEQLPMEYLDLGGDLTYSERPIKILDSAE
jgi:hypothetical protein